MTNQLKAINIALEMGRITAPFANEGETFSMTVNPTIGAISVTKEIRKRTEIINVIPMEDGYKLIYKSYYENRDDQRKEMEFETLTELVEMLETFVSYWD